MLPRLFWVRFINFILNGRCLVFIYFLSDIMNKLPCICWMRTCSLSRAGQRSAVDSRQSISGILFLGLLLTRERTSSVSCIRKYIHVWFNDLLLTVLKSKAKSKPNKTKHTFRILGMVTAGGFKLSSGSSFLDFEITRGRMLRKMVMMRMLIGNMRRPLWTPTIISCQVMCIDPAHVEEWRHNVDVNYSQLHPKTAAVAVKFQSHTHHSLRSFSRYWLNSCKQIFV